MDDVGLGYTKANVSYMQNLIRIGLEDDSIEAKNNTLFELSKLLDELSDNILNIIENY